MTCPAEHTPQAVRTEFEGWDRVPRSWVRMARRGCPDCARWDARRTRLTAIRSAYRRRVRGRSR